METPAFEKSFKGAFIWFLWKIGFVTYVLTSALPMIGFICCLFIIAIKRDAPILISIIMMIMLHPMFTLVIGSSIQTMGKFLSRYCSKFCKHKILARLFTYSINCNFAMVAGLTMYMYKMWHDLGKRAEFAFSDKSFDQCTCDVLKAIGQVCVNRETGYSFQNLFLLWDMQLLLLSFFITSIACHLIQSLFLCLPAPLPLYQFIVGQENKDEVIEKELKSEYELENLDFKHKAKSVELKAHDGFVTKGIRLVCCIIAVVFFVGLAGVPFYGFDQLPGEAISTENGGTYEIKFNNEIMLEDR